ncbi:hypothetical protein SMICM17S_12035 [Streptomyces microflavus]
MILTDPVGHLTGQHRIEILSTIHDADADAWNRVVGLAAGSVFHTWQWLAAFEDAPPGEFEPRHIAAYQGDELVGICPAYLVHDDDPAELESTYHSLFHSLRLRVEPDIQ